MHLQRLHLSGLCLPQTVFLIIDLLSTPATHRLFLVLNFLLVEYYSAINMDCVTCGSFFLSLWEPVREAVLSFCSTAVSGSLCCFRDRVLAYLWVKKAVKVPISDSVVGREETLLEIRRYLRDDAVGIIGIYGMGGVGKTTILKKINNDLILAGNNDFDITVLVTVSGNAEVSVIQEEIGDRLGFPLPTNEGDRKSSLYQALSERKFLLLLDDVWKRLDLERMGIPDPRSHNRAKVVLATRSEEVCADMGAQARVKVSVLDERESWNLFCSKVHPRVPLHDDVIGGLAEVVVRKCGGLPLALVTVGKAMSNATTVGEWKEAAMRLRESPNKVRGMEDVLSIMKFSFDSLADDVTRECLLYCSLFPEDYSIKIEQLVEYWIGEGFLDAGEPDSASISQAHDTGYRIIRNLKDACLLESGEDEDKHVKMHDIVREMALWLTGKKVDKTKRFIVCGGKGFTNLSGIDEWESARRISIVRQEVVELPSPTSGCSNLLTLLVVANPLGRKQEPVVVPRNLFEFMPALRVLDLSCTNIREIPGEIGLLMELRYLNLSWTKIRQLPEELGKLVKLRELSLWGTVELSQVPRKAIVTLTRLQRLYLYRCGYSVSFGDDESEGINWKDLDLCLGNLEEFSVDIHNTPPLTLLATSSKLSRCIKGLRLVNIPDLLPSHLSTAFEQLVNMEWLSIEDCRQLEELRIVGGRIQLQNLKYLGLARLNQLREVVVVGEPIQGDRGDRLLLPRIQHLEIDSCDGLQDLGWLRQLPSLEKLLLWSCRGMEVVLPLQVDGSCTSSLSLLKYMSLVNLPALKSISVESLTFPSLQVLWVSGCPSLKRLPFGAYSCKKIREIFGSREWWYSLEWGDDGGNGASSNQHAPLTSTLREIFHPISSSAPSEIVVECRKRFL